jgi:hypothetical protein
MASVIPPVYIRNPNSNAQRYGLFNVANGPLDFPDPHAREGGVQYETSLCDIPYGYPVLCQTNAGAGAPVAKVFTAANSTVSMIPFVVVASTLCGPIGRSEEDSTRLVVEKLKAGEQAVVEAVFSAGTFFQAPSLANNTPNATVLAASANVDAAIGNLESWLYARYGPVGVLHIPIAAANFVVSNNHVRLDNGVWKTAMGTPVSFGNYANLLPAGGAAAATAFYITGQMTVWRTGDADIFVSPYDRSIDKVTNQVRRFAEREYAVGYECFAAATDTTLVSPS